MKKYITLFSVIALFFVGMQNSVAQEKKQRPEEIAKIKTHDLHQLVDLTGEQQGEIFKVFVDAESNMSAISSQGQNIQASQKTKSAVLENTNTRIKAILNPEQYAIYLKSLEKEKDKVKK
ncbi:hypothetical protein [Hanstruepera neustonica]|nr:hypothetical protein [Hanstruepera neustonica]